MIGLYFIHDKDSCTPPCPFHSPSDHPLKDAKTHIRADKDYLVERICEHGIGHDDPDSVKYMQAHGAKWAGVHGCDGCCGEKIPSSTETEETYPTSDSYSNEKLEDTVGNKIETYFSKGNAIRAARKVADEFGIGLVVRGKDK